jgi:ABC-type uncharacterized transport system auxiliary subunit
MMNGLGLLRRRNLAGLCEVGQSGPRRALPAKLGLPLILLLGAGFLSGCLSRPALTRQSFSFSIPSMVTNAPAGRARVLEIRQVTVAAPFDSQSFVYRTGAYSYERDPYAQFLVPPAETLVAPLRGYLMESGLFQDVVSRESELKSDLLVQVRVEELYGDFRNRSAPVAVLRMSVVFVRAGNGARGKVWLQKRFEQRIPFRQPTAAALMAAWDQGLKRIAGELNEQLREQAKSAVQQPG